MKNFFIELHIKNEIDFYNKIIFTTDMLKTATEMCKSTRSSTRIWFNQ